MALRLLRSLKIFLLLVTGYWLLVTPANAAGEFDVAYETTYEIQTDGSAKVVTDVSLTNKLSNVYATEYNLVLEKGEISQIKAWDSQGELQTKIETGTEQTKINLKFNDQIAGIDKTLRFTLKYEVAGLAKKSGEVWQVALPKQVDLGKLADFKLTLKIPKSFPALAFIAPQPDDQTATNEFYQYSFDQKSLKETGVVAAFGQFQVFDFTLHYHLVNPKGEKVFTKVALPPTTPYQQVSYFSLEPKPENVEVDQDGNWLAVFLLAGGEKKEVIASGQAQILAKPAAELAFSKIDFNQYLGAQPFWEVNGPEIKKLALELKTPSAIYNYVIKTLSYDFEKVKTKQERMGAAEVLKKPDQAICMEFTDLFIALARAAGIPAREVNGYAHTDNPKLKPLSESADILHSWPEYWDEKRQLWIPVDPTWEKTSGIDYFGKFDLSHFTFAIHGVDSQYPAAAGSYKEDQQRQKDIQINFGTFEGKRESQLTAQFLLPKSYFVERGVKGKIVLENLGPAAFYNLLLAIEAEGVKLKSQKELVIAALPPFAKKEVSVAIDRSWRPKGGKVKITLLANKQSFSYNMVVSSLILNFVLPVVGGVAVGGSLLVFVLKYRR